MKNKPFAQSLGIVRSAVLLVFVTMVSTSHAQETNAEKSPRLLVHLLDYLSSDYPGAVENGRIKSASEYNEQSDFAAEADSLAQTLPDFAARTDIKDEVKALHKLILNKADSAQVSELARRIQQEVVKAADIKLAPKHWPDIKSGARLFATNCMSCHGANGLGDGPLASSYTPPPANLQNAEKMDELSPFQVFNTIHLGVPGTAMQAHPEFSDRETWDLAFYVVSLRHQSMNSPVKKANLKLSDISDASPEEWLLKTASLSDKSLITAIGGSIEGDRKLKLSYLRLRSPSEDERDFLGLARANIDEVRGNYSAGRKDEAAKHALSAYLDGIEPIEAKIRANSPELVIQIEESMAALRTGIKANEPIEQIEKRIALVEGFFSQAETLLESGKQSFWFSFSAAAGVLLREGLEAVLLIVALLGVIRASGARRAAAWVHGGWIAAFAAGLVFWCFSGWALRLSGAHRETTEAAISLFAVAVLLYFGFWLHRKTEIGRWKHFIDTQIKTALEQRSLLGLAAISFFAVFREALETVLFLRAVSLEGGSTSTHAIGLGVGAALVVVLGLSWALLKFSRKIPIRRLFMVTSGLMVLLAIVITGKAFHSLQESGLISVNPFWINIRVDSLGLYPTIQTLAAQIAATLLSVGLLVWAGRPLPSLTAEDAQTDAT